MTIEPHAPQPADDGGDDGFGDRALSRPCRCVVAASFRWPATAHDFRWLTLLALIVSLAPLSLPAARYTGEPEIQAHPLSPAEALARFRVEEGLRVELVAAEPLVTDPVDIAFDESGRMFVAEIMGYNRGPDGKPRSRVRVLEDTDGDGRMDRVTTLADDLDYAQGLLAMRGGVLVTTNSGILFLRDGDGDGRAEIQERLFDVTTSLNVDRQMASPRRGLDNAIYINLGLGKKEITPPHEPGRKIDLVSNNLRYDPGSGEFGPSSGAGQFGNTFDDWGRQFFSTNRNPALFAMLPHRFLLRNPAAFLSIGEEDAAPSGGDSKVYPLKAFRTTSSAHAGTYTAACGIGAYRGDWLGAEYVGNLFVCEPTGELVSRWIPEPSGPGFKARRPYPGREFLASDDEWFRPVNITTGPDGALYVVDMYRRFIDGERFFPPEYTVANDMGAGRERGRIYRVVPAAGGGGRRNWTPVPPDAAGRIALLAHPNGWHRDTAQRLLVEAGDVAVVPAVEAHLFRSPEARARLHALWTIAVLGRLEPAHVRAALADTEPGMVENALWLAPRFLPADDEIRRRVLALAGDASRGPRVRFAALLAVGDLPGPDAIRTLVQAGMHDAEDPWMRTAILSAPATQSGGFLAALVREPGFRSPPSRGRTELAHGVAMILGAGGKAAELKPVFAVLAGDAATDADNWWKMAVVSGLTNGLRRQSGTALPASVSALLNRPPPELAETTEGVRRIVSSALGILRDSRRPVVERLAAIPMLEHLPQGESAAIIGPLLQRSEPPEIQRAMLDTVIRMDRRFASALIYEHLAGMGAAARIAAVQFLQRNPMELLRKIQAGAISAYLLDASARWIIANTGSAEVRALGQEVLGQAETDRAGLVARYTAGLAAQTGSVAAGRALFQQACAACHRFRGEGQDIGPDISDVRIKTPAMLLADILDPNATVEPRWESYSLRTRDGRIFVGLIESETNDAITIKGLAGKETIPRGQIEAYEPLGVSLMPPGLEASLPEPKMADLLAYLRSGDEGN